MLSAASAAFVAASFAFLFGAICAPLCRWWPPIQPPVSGQAQRRTVLRNRELAFVVLVLTVGAVTADLGGRNVAPVAAVAAQRLCL